MKALKIKAFAGMRSDEALEAEGKFAEVAPGVEFKIRRIRSKPVMDARRKIYGPHERAMAGKDLPEKIETMCTIRLLSEAVVVDWRGEEMKDDETGEPVPFTTENAAALFSDPETGKDLRSVVLNLANDGDFYAPEDTQADTGN